MEVLPEPQDGDDKVLELLKNLMGENGITFLDLDNAITAVKQGRPSWQAPFAIGLLALIFIYFSDNGSRIVEGPVLIGLVLQLASKIESKDELTEPDLVAAAFEPLEAQYALLSGRAKDTDWQHEDNHTLFHTRFALGLLALLKGDEELAAKILRELASTKMARRGGTITSEGLTHFDVQETKTFAAIILQDFYARKQDYEMALYFLTEAVASDFAPYAEDLLAVVPGLMDSFAEKCEKADDFGDWFEGWVNLIDKAANIIEVCGEADVSGDLPSDCKVASPQFLAWAFGKLAARFAMRYSADWDDSEQLLPTGYSGEDWGNGTVVASLLCEYDEHRNWQSLRQHCVSMWEASARYQWLSLCHAGTETDIYWAVRIGFADKMLEFANLESLLPVQTEPSAVTRDIEMTKNIVSHIAIRQIKEHSDVSKVLEFMQKMDERLSPSKSEIIQQLQQNITVWDKLPGKIIESLIQAETLYRTGVKTDDSKGWFNKTVEACISYYFEEPVISFRRTKGYKEISIKFPLPEGKSRNTGDKIINWWSLLDLSDVLNVLSGSENKKQAIEGIENLKQTIKEKYGDLSLTALGQLSGSLRDFYLRKESGHDHPSRYEEELQELERMRELVLGTNRLSIITQIFQCFPSSS